MGFVDASKRVLELPDEDFAKVPFAKELKVDDPKLGFVSMQPVG